MEKSFCDLPFFSISWIFAPSVETIFAFDVPDEAGAIAAISAKLKREISWYESDHSATNVCWIRKWSISSPEGLVQVDRRSGGFPNERVLLGIENDADERFVVAGIAVTIEFINYSEAIPRMSQSCLVYRVKKGKKFQSLYLQIWDKQLIKMLLVN